MNSPYKNKLDLYATFSLIGYLTEKFSCSGFKIFSGLDKYRFDLFHDVIEYVRYNLKKSSTTSERNIICFEKSDLKDIIFRICSDESKITLIQDYFALLGRVIYINNDIEIRYECLSKKAYIEKTEYKLLIDIFFQCQNTLEKNFPNIYKPSYYQFLQILSQKEVFEEVFSTICFDKETQLPELLFDYCY